MNVITINQDTCTKCGICSIVCSPGLIQRDENNYPAPIPEIDTACNRCGHCVSACPNGSLDHVDLHLEQCIGVQTDLSISLEQCTQAIQSRRSVRAYKDTPIPREELTRLIDIARYAPTGGNLQGVQWLIIDDPEVMEQMRDIGRELVLQFFSAIPAYKSRLELFKKRRDEGHDIFLHGAPVVVNAYGDAGSQIATVDCTIALSYFDLLANSAGLGCCWIGMFSAAANTNPRIKDLLGLPEGKQVYGSMITGYPKYRYPRIPVRKNAEILWR